MKFFNSKVIFEKELFKYVMRCIKLLYLNIFLSIFCFNKTVLILMIVIMIVDILTQIHNSISHTMDKQSAYT